MLSSERLFSILTYALFATPAAIVVLWAVWRVMLWCLSILAWFAYFPALACSTAKSPVSWSRALSLVFLSFLILLFFVVPLKFLAHWIAGPQVSVWHWLLVFGPIPLLIVWLVARIRRLQREEAQERMLDAGMPP